MIEGRDIWYMWYMFSPSISVGFHTNLINIGLNKSWSIHIFDAYIPIHRCSNPYFQWIRETPMFHGEIAIFMLLKKITFQGAQIDPSWSPLWGQWGTTSPRRLRMKTHSWISVTPIYIYILGSIIPELIINHQSWAARNPYGDQCFFWNPLDLSQNKI